MRNWGRGTLLGPDWGVVACWCVIFSPCSSCWWRKRYKVLPAGAKWAEISVLGRAGRVLYRVGRRAGRAGRVLYRVGRRAGRAGRVLYRVWSSEVVQGGFRFVTHLEEIRRRSSRMRRGTLGWKIHAPCIGFDELPCIRWVGSDGVLSPRPYHRALCVRPRERT